MRTLIFGNGYTGSRLAKLIPNASCTELPQLCHSEELIPFDFNDTDTWKNLPEFDQAVITFKMTDEKLGKKFSQLLKGKKSILLSSARNLQNSTPDEIISEKTPLKNCSRTKAESFFEDKATILYLGLIWGPERLPEKWITEKRIKNSSKFINFINVEDLCRIIIHFLGKNAISEKYLISDGEPKKWEEVARSKGLQLDCYPAGLESRKFATEKLKQSLPENFKFQKP